MLVLKRCPKSGEMEREDAEKERYVCGLENLSVVEAVFQLNPTKDKYQFHVEGWLLLSTFIYL